MKEVVSWFYRPERPVTTNGNCARNYFSHASAQEAAKEITTRRLRGESHCDMFEMEGDE